MAASGSWLRRGIVAVFIGIAVMLVPATACANPAPPKPVDEASSAQAGQLIELPTGVSTPSDNPTANGADTEATPPAGKIGVCHATTSDIRPYRFIWVHKTKVGVYVKLRQPGAKNAKRWSDGTWKVDLVDGYEKRPIRSIGACPKPRSYVPGITAATYCYAEYPDWVNVRIWVRNPSAARTANVTFAVHTVWPHQVWGPYVKTLAKAQQTVVGDIVLYNGKSVRVSVTLTWAGGRSVTRTVVVVTAGDCPKPKG